MTVAPFNKTWRALVACAAALALSTAAAQLEADFEPALGAVEEEQPPVYTVEFLIFAYNEFNPLEEEFPPSKPKWSRPLSEFRLTAAPETLPPSSADWYLDSLTLPAPLEPPIAPVAGNATIADDTAQLLPGTQGLQLEDAGNTFGPPPETDEVPGTWYQMLDPETFELGRALARLNALGAYTPLLHGGWSQAALLEDEAIPMPLARFGQLQPAGSIRLHRSRFLHLTLDVSLQDDYRYRQAPIAPDARWPLSEFLGPTKYSIQVQRRIRSGELHFFDHPAFGVLIIVRPAPEEPETEAATAPGPAA